MTPNQYLDKTLDFLRSEKYLPAVSLDPPPAPKPRMGIIELRDCLMNCPNCDSAIVPDRNCRFCGGQGEVSLSTALTDVELFGVFMHPNWHGYLLESIRDSMEAA